MKIALAVLGLIMLGYFCAYFISELMARFDRRTWERVNFEFDMDRAEDETERERYADKLWELQRSPKSKIWLDVGWGACRAALAPIWSLFQVLILVVEIPFLILALMLWLVFYATCGLLLLILIPFGKPWHGQHRNSVEHFCSRSIVRLCELVQELGDSERAAQKIRYWIGKL